MKILILGDRGFIGRNVTEHLSKGRHELSFFYDDLTKDKLDFSGVDVAIQCAAVTSGSKDVNERPYIHVTDNAIMNSRILRACYESHVKQFVFLSCSTMYPGDGNPCNENAVYEHQINKKYYGVAKTKLYIEDMCRFYSSLGRTKHTVLRLTNVYGPHDKFDLERSHFMGATINKVMNADNGRVIVWGNGQERRDLVYIDDVVKAIEKAIESDSGLFDVFNIGWGSTFSVNEVVRKVIEKSGKKLDILYNGDAPTIKCDISVDCKKARDVLGWKAETLLEDGIKKSIDFYKSTYHSYKIPSAPATHMGMWLE